MGPPDSQVSMSYGSDEGFLRHNPHLRSSAAEGSQGMAGRARFVVRFSCDPIFIEGIPCFDYNVVNYMVISKARFFRDPGWLV